MELRNQKLARLPALRGVTVLYRRPCQKKATHGPNHFSNTTRESSELSRLQRADPGFQAGGFVVDQRRIVEGVSQQRHALRCGE